MPVSGVTYFQGGGVPGLGVCLVETPLQTVTAAGGTHPTGITWKEFKCVRLEVKTKDTRLMLTLPNII